MNVSTRFPATLVRLLMPWVLALAVADAAAQATASPEARLKALGIELPPPLESPRSRFISILRIRKGYLLR